MNWWIALLTPGSPLTMTNPNPDPQFLFFVTVRGEPGNEVTNEKIDATKAEFDSMLGSLLFIWIRKCSLWLEHFLLQVQLMSATLWDSFFSGSLSNLGTAQCVPQWVIFIKEFFASATDDSGVSAPLREFAVYLYLYDSFLLPQQVVQSGLPFLLSVHKLPHELAYLVVESWCTSKVLGLIAGNQAIHRPLS